MTHGLLVVEHDPDAPAGVLGSWAAGQGLAISTVRLHAGDPLPAISAGSDPVVVLGSEHTAYDDTLPWLGAELAFTQRLLDLGVPVLGICFGAQVLARVLGARLYRLPEPEIGWAHVTSRCPGIAAGPWLTWHRDAFTLPAGAAELAVNAWALQAFSLGSHAGVQFHPEANEPIALGWLAGSHPPPPREATDPLFGAAAAPAWGRAAAGAAALFSAWLAGRLR